MEGRSVGFGFVLRRSVQVCVAVTEGFRRHQLLGLLSCRAFREGLHRP